ncbi:hypothetical protein A0H81_11581 [Grifola frondosa]|uniref:Uncharacterized protein n=1 Tax=Grifola frondosa TaxID=5627 RepID=A0A1C7LV44_GRIFR|nr:hypothetical protein A0H81_11581 [Grifola frondosa]
MDHILQSLTALELNEPEQQQTGIEPVEEMDRDGSADDGSAGALADEEGRGRTRTRGTRRVAQRDSPTPAPDTPRDFVSRAGSPSAVGKTFASIVREMTTDWKEFRSELLRWQSERDRVGAERARRAEEQDRAIADRDDAEDTETHRAQSVADEAYVV